MQKGGLPMIEQVFKLADTDERAVEKIIADENIHYNHMVLQKGEGLPVHLSNSNVYMTVLRGTLSIALGEQPAADYPRLTLLKIPKGVRMDIKNLHDETLEFTVVKAPAP